LFRAVVAFLMLPGGVGFVLPVVLCIGMFLLRWCVGDFFVSGLLPDHYGDALAI